MARGDFALGLAHVGASGLAPGQNFDVSGLAPGGKILAAELRDHCIQRRDLVSNFFLPADSDASVSDEGRLLVPSQVCIHGKFFRELRFGEIPRYFSYKEICVSAGLGVPVGRSCDKTEMWESACVLGKGAEN